MRSTLIIASMALAILAAPVPSPEDKMVSRRDVEDSAAPIEALMDKRYQTLSTSVSKRQIRHTEASPNGRTRLNGRSVEDEEKEEDLEKRIFRNPGRSHPRSEEDDEEVEKRSLRNPGRNHPRSEEDDEEVETRAIRHTKRGAVLHNTEKHGIIKTRTLRDRNDQPGNHRNNKRGIIETRGRGKGEEGRKKGN